METNELPLTLTVEEAAELLGIGRSVAYRAVQTGEIPAIRIGRRLLVPRARLLELLGEPGQPIQVSAAPASLERG